jgi:hypothetical protein
MTFEGAKKITKYPHSRVYWIWSRVYVIDAWLATASREQILWSSLEVCVKIRAEINLILEYSKFCGDVLSYARKLCKTYLWIPGHLFTHGTSLEHLGPLEVAFH